MVKVDRAYTTLENTSENEAQLPPKLPERSYRKITDKALDDNDPDVLILQAGAPDITSFKTNIPGAKKYLEYFKQQMVIAAGNLFTVATDSLASRPALKKVVILKQVPRYDSDTTNPFRMKSLLANLFNDTLKELKASSSYKDSIYLGNYSLEYSGVIRDARYKTNHRFDGVHLFGSSGRKAYTESVLMILRESDSIKKAPHTYFRRYHSNSPQKYDYLIPTQNKFAVLDQEN